MRLALIRMTFNEAFGDLFQVAHRTNWELKAISNAKQSGQFDTAPA